MNKKSFIKRVDKSSEFSQFPIDNLEPETILYIRQLEKENLKLQEKVAKLQVSNFSKSNEIKTKDKEISNLTKEISKLRKFQSPQIYLPDNQK